MAFSAHTHQPLHASCGGATAAPPPTPSTQHNCLSTSDAADALSRLFHRLPPTLSLPSCLSPPITTIPLISLSQQNPTLLNNVISSSSQLGFFQLTDHQIPSQLALSAELEALSVFDLSSDQKQLSFPKNWPLGFDHDEDDDQEGDGNGDSFCFDASSSSSDSTELPLSSMREFARNMEKIGLKIVEALSCAVGFENPLREETNRHCSLMWVTEGVSGIKPSYSGRFYPYIIGLQYQIRCRKYSLLADSGWVSVSPQVNSVLVTVGDVAQVWSNGKLKKVRGRAVASSEDEDGSRCISMSLMVTLPTESTISPILPKVVMVSSDDKEEAEEMESKYSSFSFEDYAWKVYNERLLFKDPLDKYRI